MTGSDTFQLRHHLPHLLRRAHFESEALFAQIYGDGVTSRQLAVLSAVGRRPNASQRQIADDVGLDLNTCSDVVIRAVSKGLLQRERAPGDARSFALTLTEAGRAMVGIGAAQAAAYAEATAARLTPHERQRLVALLRKLLGFDGDPA